MAKKSQSKETAAKSCRECRHWGDVSERVRVHELLERTIAKFESKIQQADYEPTVAEYVRLLQLGREIGEEDEPKEIRVTWVSPSETLESVR